MKLGWDSDGCVFALAPAAWYNGNGKANRNTGNIPIYSKAGYTAALNNFAAGTGYLRDERCIQFNGVNSFLQTTYNQPYTDANSFTYEVKIRHFTVAAQQVIMSHYDAANQVALFFNTATSLFATSDLFVGVQERITSSWGLTNATDHTLHYVKSGAIQTLYLDGVEPTYNNRTTYDRGNQTFANNMQIGIYNGATFPYYGCMYWCAVYNYAMDQEQAAAHARLGNDMGQKGTERNGEMSLSKMEKSSSVSVGCSL